MPRKKSTTTTTKTADATSAHDTRNKIPANARLKDVSWVSSELGLSPYAIYALVRAEKLPALRLSDKTIRFDPERIQAWLKECAAKAPKAKTPSHGG